MPNTIASVVAGAVLLRILLVLNGYWGMKHAFSFIWHDEDDMCEQDVRFLTRTLVGAIVGCNLLYVALQALVVCATVGKTVFEVAL